MDQKHVTEKSLQYSQDSTVHIVNLLWSKETGESWFDSGNRQKIFLISKVSRLALETSWPSISEYHGLFHRNCQAGALSLSFPSTTRRVKEWVELYIQYPIHVLERHRNLTLHACDNGLLACDTMSSHTYVLTLLGNLLLNPSSTFRIDLLLQGHYFT